MAEALRLCSLTVCRSQLPPEGGGSGAAAADEAACPAAGGLYFGGYELLLEQDLNDGLFHEPHESGATLRLQVGGPAGRQGALEGPRGCDGGAAVAGLHAGACRRSRRL